MEGETLWASKLGDLVQSVRFPRSSFRPHCLKRDVIPVLLPSTQPYALVVHLVYDRDTFLGRVSSSWKHKALGAPAVCQAENPLGLDECRLSVCQGACRNDWCDGASEGLED